MLVLGLLAASAVVALLALLARWMWVGRRRSEAQACGTEEEARRACRAVDDRDPVGVA
jgi:uncharacterized iron-regulated membrane protein